MSVPAQELIGTFCSGSLSDLPEEIPANESGVRCTTALKTGQRPQ